MGRQHTQLFLRVAALYRQRRQLLPAENRQQTAVTTGSSTVPTSETVATTSGSTAGTAVTTGYTALPTTERAATTSGSTAETAATIDYTTVPATETASINSGSTTQEQLLLQVTLLYRQQKELLPPVDRQQRQLPL